MVESLFMVVGAFLFVVGFISGVLFYDYIFGGGDSYE
jgi:hypothetical protein